MSRASSCKRSIRRCASSRSPCRYSRPSRLVAGSLPPCCNSSAVMNSKRAPTRSPRLSRATPRSLRKRLSVGRRRVASRSSRTARALSPLRRASRPRPWCASAALQVSSRAWYSALARESPIRRRISALSSRTSIKPGGMLSRLARAACRRPSRIMSRTMFICSSCSWPSCCEHSRGPSRPGSAAQPPSRAAHRPMPISAFIPVLPRPW